MSTVKNMMPFLMALSTIGSQLYYLPKNLQNQIGGGYPKTRIKKMSKSILTLHKKAYSNKYDRIK
jgi:hypothetical protein